MGSGAVQITFTLFTILGAAGLALVCDYLRHRNEELKAAMAAMRAGQVDVVPTAPTARPAPLPVKQRTKASCAAPSEVKPAEEVVERIAEAEAEPVAVAPPIETQSRRPRRRRPVEVEEGEWVRRKATRTESEMEAERLAFIERAMSVAAELASKEGQVVEANAAVEEAIASQELIAQPELVAEPEPVAFELAPKPEPKSEVNAVMQQMSTDGAMKDWLSRRAAARMAIQKVEQEEVIAAVESPALADVPQTAENIAAPVVEEVAVSAPEPHVDHKQWSSLFEDEPKLVLVNRKEHTLEVVPNSGSRPSSGMVVPTGVQDSTTLSRLLGSNQPYTGLVICICVKDMEERVIDSIVTSFLTELSRPGDMLCRSSKDEFVLLCPDERGADNRRRLGVISQQLWDYQLRNLSNFSVLFSWGSEEAWRARLSDALSAARDSMAVTRRARGQEPAGTLARRQAV